MTNFVRHKHLESKYFRILVDERLLNQLAKRVCEHTSSHGEHLEIKILCLNETDEFHSKDASFFLSEDLPTQIKSISISYRHYKAPITCSIKIGSETTIWGATYSSITVEGSDPHVSGLFQDLSNEIEQRRVWGASLPSIINSFVFAGVCLIALMASLYFTFDWILDSIADTAPEFKDSQLHLILSGVCLLVTILPAFLLSSIIDLISNLVPSVIFGGRLSESRTTNLTVIIGLLIWIIIALSNSAVTQFFRSFIAPAG